MTSFAALGLSASLIRWIEAEGFTEPTEIQAKAIPILLEGRDLTGTAQTGEGKTAAYLLPILNRLTGGDAEAVEEPISRRPQVLILAPTRELAGQIGDALRQFSKGMRVYYTVIFGGSRFLTQQKVMDRGVQILIATPGRLMDHHRRGTVRLDRVTTFVLDEADRMLDMGFVNEVKEIAGLIPTAHQTIMFSATMSRGVRDLAASLLHNPARLDVGKENAVAANVDHRVMRVQYRDKKPLLMHLLGRPEVSRVLVFTRTKAMADVLAKEIQEAGLAADAIHGDREQSTRQKVLKDFRDGRINILVATDVAARGIDVPDITHVINYDMPIEGDAYVHRVGRTGRAGAKGTALSIATGSEGNLIRIVERVIGQRIPVDTSHPFHDARPDDGAPKRGYDSARGSRSGPRPRKEFDKAEPKPHRKGPRADGERPERPAYAERAERPQRRPEGERSFRKDGERPYEKKFGEKKFGEKKFDTKSDKPFQKTPRAEGERSFKKDSERPYAKKFGEKKFGDKTSDKPFHKGPRADGERRERPAYAERAERSERPQRSEWRPEDNRPAPSEGERPVRTDGDRPFKKEQNRGFKKDGDRPFRKDGERTFKKDGDRPFRKSNKTFDTPRRRDDRADSTDRRPEGAVVRAKDGVTAFRSQDAGAPGFKKKKPFKKKEGAGESRAGKPDVPQKTRADLGKKRNRSFETERRSGGEVNAGGFKPRTRRPQ